MAYSKQTFSVGQVLTAAQMNQVETNIQDHVHGVGSVSDLLLGQYIPGYVDRAQLGNFTYNAVFIGPGVYHHNGTTEQFLVIPSTLQFGLGTAAASQQTIQQHVAEWANDATARGDAAHNGVVVQTAAVGAEKASATSFYFERHWNSKSVVISGFKWHGSSDQGIVNSISPNVTVTLYGSDTGAFGGEETNLGSVGPTTDSTGLIMSKLSGLTATGFLHHRLIATHDGAANDMYAAEVEFYATTGSSNASNSALGASQRFYLYLDDSAIVTAGTNIISESEIVATTTGPDNDSIKVGHYNGNDRCIGSVTSTALSRVVAFWHDGGDMYVQDAEIIDASAITPSNIFQDVVLSIPSFASRALVSINGTYVDADATLLYRKENSNTAVATSILRVTSTHTGALFNSLVIAVGLSQVIDIAWNVVTTNGITVRTYGWLYPGDM